LRECVELIGHGVPVDVAFSLSNDMRVAWLIILGEQKGSGVFDWNDLRWKPRK